MTQTTAANGTPAESAPPGSTAAQPTSAGPTLAQPTSAGPTLVGIVLAGGLSRRMSRPKPLLPIEQEECVVRCARIFRDLGAEPLVVLCADAGLIVPVLDEAGVRYVVNRDYRRGMYSSVMAGVDAAGPQARWVAVLPVDMPLVRAETVGALVRAAHPGDAVVHPCCRGVRGHPPLLGRGARARLPQHSPGGGLEAALASFALAPRDVPVDDAGILIDMDDDEAYERVVELARRERVPDAAECCRLMETSGVPAEVKAHCRTVARVALSLGRALQHAGACLNLRLLEAAALLHDVARDRPDHAGVGAALLRAARLPRVAAVVAGHMDLAGPPASIPGEVELLYLADKLVEQDRIVPLQVRLDEALRRFDGDAAAGQAARRRIEVARRLAAAVERCTGRPLARLIA